MMELMRVYYKKKHNFTQIQKVAAKTGSVKETGAGKHNANEKKKSEAKRAAIR